MDWRAIIFLIACSSRGKCQEISFKTCPPRNIEVDNEISIKLSSEFKCSFLIQPKSTYFVKVEVEAQNASNNPQYILFFNRDTSKLFKYTPGGMSTSIVSTKLEVREAQIDATLKISPWGLTKINGHLMEY